MLKAPRIVYYCDHIINRVIKDTIIDSITRSSDPEDVIITDGSIKKISSVYIVENEDEFTFYYNGIHFNTLNRSIEWISGPLVGTVYNIEYEKVKREVDEYAAEDCPRCAGNGWYVSLFNKDTTEIYTGTHKLIQEFIKILLTIKSDSYGTTLLEISSLNLGERNLVISEVMSAVYDAESQYKEMQNSDVFSGSLSSGEERLESATVQDLEIDETSGGVYLRIVIKNEAGNASEVNLLI